MRGDVVKVIAIGSCIVLGSYQNLVARVITGLLATWSNIATVVANAFPQIY